MRLKTFVLRKVQTPISTNRKNIFFNLNNYTHQFLILPPIEHISFDLVSGFIQEMSLVEKINTIKKTNLDIVDT